MTRYRAIWWSHPGGDENLHVAPWRNSFEAAEADEPPGEDESVLWGSIETEVS